MRKHARNMLPTRIYEWMLRLGFALVPSIAILYLAVFQSPEQRFINHHFHELAIGIAVALSGAIAYVTWLCYHHSGEPFLHWVAQGLTGFTVVYLPHGVLTSMADHNMALFLLFGPASRLVMAICLIIGLYQWGKRNDAEGERTIKQFFWRGMVVFIAIDLVIAALAISKVVAPVTVRLVLESGALLLTLGGIATIFIRRINTPLMWLYTVALAAFAQSSISFFLAKPWDHQWWLAHLIFAAGFFVLSFGIVRAYHTTRAFFTVYSQEELMRQLEVANNRLSYLASTDPLTGAANRRKFFERFDEEMMRRKRLHHPVSLLAIDIDHFKQINDRYGHAAGDVALKTLVKRIQGIIRETDTVGRMGGEEFSVLLPGIDMAQANDVAERIRASMSEQPVHEGKVHLPMTVSIGVAELDSHNDIDALIQLADQRLYQAKEAGRNQIVSD